MQSLTHSITTTSPIPRHRLLCSCRTVKKTCYLLRYRSCRIAAMTAPGEDVITSAQVGVREWEPFAKETLMSTTVARMSGGQHMCLRHDPLFCHRPARSYQLLHTTHQQQAPASATVYSDQKIRGRNPAALCSHARDGQVSLPGPHEASSRASSLVVLSRRRS